MKGDLVHMQAVDSTHVSGLWDPMSGPDTSPSRLPSSTPIRHIASPFAICLTVIPSGNLTCGARVVITSSLSLGNPLILAMLSVQHISFLAL